MRMMTSIDSLIGKKVISIEKTKAGSDGDIIKINTDSGLFTLYHELVCCESVAINSCDDLSVLIGKTITSATEESVDAPKGHDFKSFEGSSETWTLYQINGLKILWHGSSNGYYGETPLLYLDETIKTVDLEEDLKLELDEEVLKPSLFRS